MQTIFRADLRKLQSSDACIPRHLLSHGLAAARAQAAPEEAAGIGEPKPSTRPDRRGLETGGRDLPRRTGLGRVMTNSFVPARGCISQLKIHPRHIVGVPTRRVAGDGPGLALALLSHPHGPASHCPTADLAEGSYCVPRRPGNRKIWNGKAKPRPQFLVCPTLDFMPPRAITARHRLASLIKLTPKKLQG